MLFQIVLTGQILAMADRISAFLKPSLQSLPVFRTEAISKTLIIVESPTKAKTIRGYLDVGYEVVSSYGHIRDLPEKGMAVNIENDFEPTYEIPLSKRDTVAALRKHAGSADQVWLAMDEDREGEAIAWHLVAALKLDETTTQRISFSEITKSAILEAIGHPRSLNHDLVMAQQARRVLDRLVGFELSPLLWRKVKPQLSAGRVQSIAVRIIIDRERERFVLHRVLL